VSSVTVSCDTAVMEPQGARHSLQKTNEKQTNLIWLRAQACDHVR
jgi:hypothetical protein